MKTTFGTILLWLAITAGLAGIAWGKFGDGFGEVSKHRVQVSGIEKPGTAVLNFTGVTSTGPTGGVLTVQVAGGVGAVPTNRTLTTTQGVTCDGGGSCDLSANRTLSLSAGGIANDRLANSALTVATGAGLSGGGSISLGGTRTVDLKLNAAGALVKNLGVGLDELGLPATGVTAQAYGSATQVGTFTVDAQGRLTAAANQAIGSLDVAVLSTGVLPLARGGTNATLAGAAGAIAYSSGTAYGFSGSGTLNQLLKSGGAGAPTWGQVNLASGTEVTGTVGIGNGGTGLTSAGAVANRVILTADGAVFSVGQVNNSMLANSSLTVSAGTGLTGGGGVALGGSVTVSLATPVAVVNGGTNATALGSAGSVPYATLTAYGFSNAGSSGQLLTSGGTGAPAWITTIPIANGGTALATTPTNGQLLIGNGTNYTLATLTGTANQVSITNGAGSITIATPQDIAAGSSPTFAGLTLNGTLTRAADSTVDLTGAATRTLDVLNSTASQVADVRADGVLRFRNGTAFAVTISGTPTADRTHTFPDVASDTVVLLAALQTLTGKTLSAPTLSGTVAGTYNIGGTVGVLTSISMNANTLAGPMTLSGNVTFSGGTIFAGNNDIEDVDEIEFITAVAGATALGRVRRNGSDLELHDGTASRVLYRASGVDVAVADGGTGASDVATARTNLAAAGSAITVTGTSGVSGGGDLTVNRTLSLDQAFAPTFTGLHTWDLGTSQLTAIHLNKTAPGVAGQRDGDIVSQEGASFDTVSHVSTWRFFPDVILNSGKSVWTLQNDLDGGGYTTYFEVGASGASVPTGNPATNVAGLGQVSDDDTGLYWPSADNLELRTANAIVMTLTSGQDVTMPATTTVTVGANVLITGDKLDAAQLTGTTPVVNGGTGASTTAGALNNLKVAHDSIQGSIQTTDATQTTCATYTIGAGKAIFIEANLAGRQSDTTAGGYKLRGGYRNNAGTATAVSVSTPEVTAYEDDAAWVGTLTVSGAAVRISVTGVAATTIDWDCHALVTVTP